METEMEEKNQENPGFGKGLILGVIIGILFCSLMVGAFLLTRLFINKKADSATSKVTVSKPIDESVYKKIKNIEKVINQTFYVYDENVTTEKLEEGIYNGMLASLNDPYSEYYSVEDLNEEMNDYEGISYGIGCYVTLNEDGIAEIYGVMDESPAKEAGVKEGDLIMEVNGESVVGLTLSQVVERIKGPEGTAVTVVFSRDGELITLEMKRGKILDNTSVVYGTLLDDENIGYIRIKEFDDKTPEQVVEALDSLEEEKVKALVLDLRYNPGGNLDAVVEVARYFIPEGLIVYTEDKSGARREFSSDGSKQVDLPLAVLINEYSASAAEILSGAIQDTGSGTLIGTTTYGKGIVQSIKSLGDGTAIKITTSAYFTPNGRNIQGSGISPDIELEYDTEAAEKDETDNQVNKAIEILEEKIK